MKRIALLAVLLTISVLVGTEVIGMAEANPFGLAVQMDAPSDAKPPIISISSPQNSTNYSDTFNFTFSVQEPIYFKSTVIANIWYTLDNTKTVSIPYQYWTVTQGLGESQYSTSIIAPTLTAGNHTLKIRAEGGSYDFHNYFLINSYSQVYFTVSDNCTQNQTPTQDAGLSNTIALPSIYILTIITLIAVAIVASISLVYFKRRI
jgi:hypothetical protein